jgi:hypothetical protein
MAFGARNCPKANESESVLRVERSCHIMRKIDPDWADSREDLNGIAEGWDD